MKLKVLSKENLETARIWRNENLVSFRTPYPLTREQQEEFYLNIICNRNSNLQYRGFWINNDELFIGYGGIENIEWRNRIGEISIVIASDYRNKGYGTEALHLILDMAFNYLNLETVFAECYHCNNSLGFWRKMAEKYQAARIVLPNRKYWAGEYWESDYITFWRERCASLL